MNAGKSIELIKVAYNYEERGKQVLTLIPATDDRYGTGLITSRIGIQREAMIVGDDTNILELYMRESEKRKIDCVLIDECQFLKKHHVQELVEIVDTAVLLSLFYWKTDRKANKSWIPKKNADILFTILRLTDIIVVWR